MSTKILFRTQNSCITIKDDKLYILSSKYKTYSPRAITIMPGFQIEIGRNINDIEEALKETRLPIILKTLTEVGNSKHIQIIRMHTGKVDDKVIAIVVCKDNIINTVSFNKELIKDHVYRKYNQLSVYHQVSLPFELSESNVQFRRDQVLNLLKTIIPDILCHEVEVIEDGKKLTALLKDDDIRMKLLFISNKNNNNRYELMSISSL